jgi:rhamnogalacturonyl hydrolase YesR
MNILIKIVISLTASCASISAFSAITSAQAWKEATHKIFNEGNAYGSSTKIDHKAESFSADWTKDAVSEVADTVFTWIMKQSAKDKYYFAQDWISGVLYNGLFDWAEASGNQKYSDFLKKTFSRFYWQVGNRMYHADDLCVGQAYLDMYAKYKDPNMMIPTKARVDWVIANPPAENIDITKGPSDRWWWCDALYMAPAVYTRLYSITGDKKYIKFAFKEYAACYNHLYDKDEHLFYRDGNYIGKTNAAGKKIFWSRGNGWVMAGLAEILKTLPQKDRKYRPFFEQLLKEMSARLASLQCSDGYWHSDLLSPELFDMPETSGTGLDTYAILYGINAVLLDEATYMPVVKKGWEAMVKAVDPEGKVCWTQTVAGAPDKVEKDNNRPYSSGAFLMTASEILKYLDRN